MKNIEIIKDINIFIANIGMDIKNWIQVLFENHLLKVEYIKLLEMGAFIGCLLFISLIFIIESNKIKRTEFLGKNTSSYLEIGLILGTLTTLILMFINSSTFNVSIIFIIYLFFAYTINKIRIHFFEKTGPKTKYQKQII
ncbi:hypothetical protein [Mariniplasma anaerobium]|uniref:Uncharacterized protein n=1 Tax=Mariniplasma anaerobium TaxID=2735436 RepID=A0A7U9TGR3_9MOLU|nr:hypothetical protein [Mariniplasma anaerobium]BCR35865.1 hypothetical protein MPAN_007580 [Mariniplasma anaerobium]